MDHGLDIEKRVRDGLLQLGKDLGDPADRHQRLPLHHAARTPPPTSTCSASRPARRWPTPSGSSSTATATTSSPPAEMRELWAHKHGMKEACDNTLLIAERCEVDFTEGNGTYMPRFPVPAGETEESWFRQRGRDRAAPPLPRRVSRRRSASAPTSRSASSSRWASRATSWWSPTSSTGPRTTASGSARAAAPAPARSCAYAMRITDLDPLEHGLIFERFLNPERLSMPDFDIDFDERRRGEVIRYVTEKYGEDRVVQIVTYGTIKAKQAVKDSAASPRLPVRDGRPDHQGDAGGGDGQGHPAQGDLRPRAPSATARAGSSARSTRPTTTSRPSSTPRSGSRASSGSGACTPPA